MKYGLDSDHVRSQTPSGILRAELRQHVGRLCRGDRLEMDAGHI